MKNKREYLTKGPTEEDPPSLFDPIIGNYLEEIINQNDSNFSSETISLILNHIEDIPNAFSSLSQNKDIRKKFTNVFILLLKNNDVKNVKEFLKEPIAQLVNLFSQRPELQNIAIDYLISFINNHENLDKAETTEFLQHIKDIVLKCNLSSINGSFDHLNDAIASFLSKTKRGKEVEDFFAAILSNQLNPLFSQDGLEKTINHEKSISESLRRIINECDVILEILVTFNEKNSFNKNNLLIKNFISNIKNPEILELLKADDIFKDKIFLIFRGLLKNNDMRNVYLVLKSPLSQFIDFKDKTLKKDILEYLSKNITHQELTDNNINDFIKHIWKIVDTFKITPKEFEELNVAFSQRLRVEQDAFVKDSLQTFVNQIFNN